MKSVSRVNGQQSPSATSARWDFLTNHAHVLLSISQDPGIRLRMQELLIQLWREQQSTVFLVTHSVEEAVWMESQGADYIILGPIYETPSKQLFGPPLGIHTLEEACRLVHIPIIGIGGVTAARAREMRRAGAFGAAVITAILGATDVESAARELLDAVTLVP